MPVKISGKEYKTVAERVDAFRAEYWDWSIITKIIKADDYSVIARTQIKNEAGRLISTGWAEEVRGGNTFIKDAEVELAETSAVGRALAFYKYAGGEVASADEVVNAQQANVAKDLYVEWQAFTEALTIHYRSLVTIRDFLADDNFDAAREAWAEIPDDDKHSLWRAYTKGGFFTTRETNQMKYWSNDFEQKRGDM